MAYIPPATPPKAPVPSVTPATVLAEIPLVSGRRFLVNDDFIDEEGPALQKALMICRESGDPVTVYELQLVPVITLTPPTT
jgi:hypothetical protein